MPYKAVGISAATLLLALVVGASVARSGQPPPAGVRGSTSQRIAFTSGTNSGWRLFVMNADGSGVQPITDDTAFDFEPAWSPAGDTVAFVSNGRGGASGIFKINVDGSGLVPLSDQADYDPAWSPDGQRIAFAFSTIDIYVMDADGSNRRQLTQDPAPENQPAWSPDGTKIAFVRDNRELYVMESDGRLPRPLVSLPFAAEHPSWSPDGTHIVFVGHPQPPPCPADSSYCCPSPAARRGVQPRRDPLRPAARLPAVGGGGGDGGEGRRLVRRPRTHPAGLQPAGAGPADGPPIAAELGAAGPHRRPADRGGERLPGDEGRRRRCAGPAPALVEAAQPFRPSWGEPYVEIAARMLAAVETARDAARGHAAVLVSHQLPIWTLRLNLEGRRYVHDPRRRQCGLASVTTLTYDGDSWPGSPTPSRPAPPLPTRCPGHEGGCSRWCAALALAGCSTGSGAVT